MTIYFLCVKAGTQPLLTRARRVSIVNNMIPCIVTGITALVGIYLLWLLWRSGKAKNALFMTTLYATCGAATLCTTVSIVAVSARRQVSIVIVNGTKVDAYVPASSALLIFAFFFLSLSALNVSLVWIEVAQAAQRFKQLTASRVQVFRNGLLVYYLFYFILILAGILLQSITLVLLCILPCMTFILITYLYGWLQLRPLLRMKPSDNTTVQQSKKKAHVLRLIAQTAITLSALSVVFMVCVITYAIMLIRNVPVSPVSQTPNIFSGLFEECSCWMQVVVMRYCYLSVSNKQGSSSANHVPKTTGDTAAGSVSASRVAEGKMSVKLVSPAHAVTAPSSAAE